MIKRAISLFIVIAFAFSFGALSIGAYNETDTQLLDALFNQSMQNDERIEQIQSLLNQMKDQNSEAWRDSSLAYQTMAEDFEQFYNYFKNEFLPQYEESLGNGVVDEYSDPEMSGYEYYVKGYNGDKSLIFIDRFTSIGAPFLCNGVNIAVPDKIGQGKWYYSGTMEPTGTGHSMPRNYTLSSIISHNLPIYYSSSEVEDTTESEYPDLFEDPETNNVFDPTQLTPDELIDLLEDAAKDFITEYPDYTTIEGILRSILAILQKGQEQGLDTTNLQELADALGCKCPTEEQINAAILTVMGNDERSLTDVYKVLLDVRDGTDNLDEILHQLRVLNGLEINEQVNEELEEFAEDFALFTNSLLDMISSLRGTGEFLTISAAITNLQNTLLLSEQEVTDMYIDLSFVGAGRVTFLKASDFQEGGIFAPALVMAKGFVGIVLILVWLHAARKKYINMMEVAGYS
jgi:hypothetical protein